MASLLRERGPEEQEVKSGAPDFHVIQGSSDLADWMNRRRQLIDPSEPFARDQREESGYLCQGKVI